MMRRVMFVLLAILSVAASAESEITKEHVLDLLAKEKAFVQKHDFAALETLITENAEFVFKDKVKVSKSEYVTQVARSFMNADKILYKPELIAFLLADDRASAEITVQTTEKYLFVRGNRQIVDGYTNVTRSIVVLDDGVAKYRYSEYVRGERAP